MDGDGRSPSAIMLGLSVPGDHRFSDTVRALATRVAAYVGYSPRDAQAIGEAVERAIAGIARHAPAENVEIRFATGETQIEIRILFAGEPGTRADLERIRGVMHVEFESEGDRTVCRLVRALPVSI